MQPPVQPPRDRFYRKIIRITALDSPNVRLALAEIRAGRQPSGTEIVPNVLSWDEYQRHLALWDDVMRCVGLEANFWEGSEALLYPPQWLNRANTIHEGLRGRRREAVSIGVDPGEGGAETSMTAVDALGIVEEFVVKTPNTNDVVNNFLAFRRRHPTVDEGKILFDQGGGGKQHADRLRASPMDGGQGMRGIRTVPFGASVTLPIKRGLHILEARKDVLEERYACVNKRAEMAADLRQLLDPDAYPCGFGIPRELVELRRQLAPLPLTYDGEGRLYLLPKHNPRNPDDPRTLVKLLGCSPDRFDSCILAVHGMVSKTVRPKVGTS